MSTFYYSASVAGASSAGAASSAAGASSTASAGAAAVVKGKGVSFMEDQVSWHGTAPNAEQYEQAMSELTQALAELEA